MALYSDSGRGGVRPSESQPGWSARVLFGPGAAGQNVKLGYYLYWLNQQTAAGDKVWWSQEIPLDERVCVEGRVSMNTPGQSDGELNAWVSGDEVLSRNEILYRTASQGTVRIRDFMFTILYRGPTTPPRDTSVSLDGLTVADHRVGCGSTVPGSSFEDTVDSPFIGDIEWLADEGITKGCNPTANTRFCPDQAVTRGQMAAFLRRALDGLLTVPQPPNPPPDPPTMWGVDVSDYKASLSTMAAAGHPIDMVHVAYPLTRGDWLATGPSGIAQWAPLQMSNIHEAGAVPFVTFSHSDLAGFNAGRYDGEFNVWLDVMAGWLNGDPARRMVLAPFPNANNKTLAYGDDAPGFRAAYRKVHAAIRARGLEGSKVRFAYQMADELNSSHYAKAAVGSGYGVYSPGVEYIDLAAISSLNTGNPLWDDWESLYAPRISEMNQHVGYDVPVLLAVVASVPGSGSDTRAAWLDSVATGVKASPTALGFIYLDRDQGDYFRVDTDSTHEQALLDALATMAPTHDRGEWLFTDLDGWQAAMRASSMMGLFADDDGSVFESDIAWSRTLSPLANSRYGNLPELATTPPVPGVPSTRLSPHRGGHTPRKLTQMASTHGAAPTDGPERTSESVSNPEHGATREPQKPSGSSVPSWKHPMRFRAACGLRDPGGRGDARHGRVGWFPVLTIPQKLFDVSVAVISCGGHAYLDAYNIVAKEPEWADKHQHTLSTVDQRILTE